MMCRDVMRCDVMCRDVMRRDVMRRDVMRCDVMRRDVMCRDVISEGQWGIGIRQYSCLNYAGFFLRFP